MSFQVCIGDTENRMQTCSTDLEQYSGSHAFLFFLAI